MAINIDDVNKINTYFNNEDEKDKLIKAFWYFLDQDFAFQIKHALEAKIRKDRAGFKQHLFELKKTTKKWEEESRECTLKNLRRMKEEARKKMISEPSITQYLCISAVLKTIEDE